MSPSRRGFRRALVTSTGVLVVAGVVVAVTVTAEAPARSAQRAGDRQPRAATSSATAGSAASPAPRSPAPPAQHGAAPPPPSTLDSVFTSFRAASHHALQAGAPDQHALAAVAQGFVKGEVEATAAEYAENGWHQEGAPKIVWTHQVGAHLEKRPPQVTVEVCVDSTGVRVVDANGKRAPGTADKPARVPQLYTLVKTGEGWKLARHSFPREATC